MLDKDKGYFEQRIANPHGMTDGLDESLDFIARDGGLMGPSHSPRFLLKDLTNLTTEWNPHTTAKNLIYHKPGRHTPPYHLDDDMKYERVAVHCVSPPGTCAMEQEEVVYPEWGETATENVEERVFYVWGKGRRRTKPPERRRNF